jgi:phage gpG-like protein
MMTIQGDFKRLRRVVATMGVMAGGFLGNSFLSSLRGGLAVRVRHLISESFSSRRSPYGVPWKPSKRPGAGDLIETGKLQGSLVIRATREGVHVSSAVPYAGVHQEGAKTGKGKIPARPFLPNRDVWPSSWAKALENETLFAVEDLWKRV